MMTGTTNQLDRSPLFDLVHTFYRQAQSRFRSHFGHIFKYLIPLFLLLGLVYFLFSRFFEPSGNLIGEANTIELYHSGVAQWHHIDLKNQYLNPVVVARFVSEKKEHTFLAEISNIRHGGFDLWVDRPVDWNSNDRTVTVNYVVFEAGTYRLGDGRRVEAGYTFSKPQASAGFIPRRKDLRPIVLTQEISAEAKPVLLRERLPLATSYLAAGLRNSRPADKKYAYIIIEPGRGKTNGKRYEVSRLKAQPDQIQSHPFGTAFKLPPVHISGLQSVSDEKQFIDIISISSSGFRLQVVRPRAVPVSDEPLQVGYLAIEAGPILSGSVEAIRPTVKSVTPNDHEKDIRRDASIRIGFQLPNKGQTIDFRTVNVSNIKLYPSGSSWKNVPFVIKKRQKSDFIEIQPTTLLEKNTNYVLEMTSGVMDESGAPIEPFKIRFTTSDIPNHAPGGIRFEQMALEGTVGRHTSLAMGPDGKLYASTFKGYIRRWSINADGTLGKLETIETIRKAENGNRLMIGLAFDPTSTPDQPVVWVSHTAFGFVDCPDWSGKVTRLWGKNLEFAQDYVINLPRSVQDHVTNSLVFGPDGALYITQGSNSAMGAPDSNWGKRKEHLLTAAVLRIDVKTLATGKLPLDVKTDDGGTYNPYLPAAPVKLFATGLRNAYDLVWHSNGNLYVPVNGSNENGAAPPSVNGTLRPDGTVYSGPDIPAVGGIESQSDYIARIPRPVGNIWPYRYYGHPNPSRGEYVLNGGNPTAQQDKMQVDEYPVGIQPDKNWQGVAYEIGDHFSANGIIEYRSNTFNGKLKGSLLVARFSSSDDILVLTPDEATGDIPEDRVIVGIEGFNQLDNPLDLVEDVRNGNLYISVFGGEGHIVLMKPTESDQYTSR